MPLEIKELNIRVTVNEQQSREATAAAPNSQQSKDAQKAMMQQLMDNVLDTLNRQKER